MKNKLVITLLCTALATTSLAGCGKKETAEVPVTESTEAVVVEVETETEEAVADETETEESTEGAELVYNTETEVVAKEDKTTGNKSEKTDSKTETKKDETKSNNTKSTSAKDSTASTGSSQSSNSGSAGTNNLTSNGSTSTETKPSASTGSSGSESGTATTTTPSTSTDSTGTTPNTSTDTTPSQPEAPKNYCPYPVWQVMDLGDGYVGYYCPDDVGTDPNYIQNWGSCEDELRSGKWGKVESVSDYPRFGPYDDDFRYVTLCRLKKVEE